MSKKLFRFHRGSLADSLATTIEIMGLTHLINEINAVFPKGYLHNIHIKNEPINDPRLPKEWNGVSYYVVADFDGYEGQCIGMSNFYEEVYIGQCTDDGKCGYQVTTDGKYSAWDNRTVEKRKADEAKAKKTAFLAELKELLARHNAKVNFALNAVSKEIGVLFEIGDDKEKRVWYPFRLEEITETDSGVIWQTPKMNYPLTADNINDYDKEEV